MPATGVYGVPGLKGDVLAVDSQGRKSRRDSLRVQTEPITRQSQFPTLGPGYEGGARKKVSLFGCSKSAWLAQLEIPVANNRYPGVNR